MLEPMKIISSVLQEENYREEEERYLLIDGLGALICLLMGPSDDGVCGYGQRRPTIEFLGEEKEKNNIQK